MAIRDESLGDLSLNNDIRPEIGIDANQDNVSLGDNNTQLFAAVSDGDTTTGRSMSEMGGEAIGPAFYPETEAAGALGESLVFDGDNQQRVERSFNYQGSKTTATISIWIKRLELSESNRMPVFYNTTSAGANVDIFGIEFEGNDRLRIFPQHASGYIETEAKLQDVGSWYHIVVGMDTTKELNRDRFKVYINGTRIIDFHQYTETTQDTANTSTTSHLLSLGQKFGGTKALHAVVGDVKYIDGYQLRADEFGELKYGVWVPKAFNAATGDSLVTSNLTANVQFNSDGKFTEEQGNHSISKSGADIIKNNHGVSHYNSINDKFTLTNTNNSNNIFDNGLSICAWIRVDDFASDNHAIVRNKSTSAEKGINFNVGTSGRLNFGVHMQNFQNSAQVDYIIKEGTWHHVVGTTDGSANTNAYKLYIDGNLVATETPSTSISSIGTFTYSATIGNRPGSLSLDNFGGQIGEVQIYTDQLTDAEVLQNYNATKYKYAFGLEGVWLPLNNTSTGSIDSSSNLKLHLDASNISSYSGSGTDWLDLTSNNNDGVLVSSPNYLTGNGGAFEFDGSNDYAQFGSSTVTSMTSLTKGTIEVWARPDSVTSGIYSRKTMVAVGHTTDNNRWAVFRLHSTQGLQLNVNNQGTSLGVHNNGDYGTLNEWNHYVVTYDGDGNYAMYINGIYQNNLTVSGNGWFNTPGGNTFDVAKLDRGSLGSIYDPFDGEIAQVRIYDKALTAQEVIANYRATQGNYEQLSTVDISGNANTLKENILNLDYTNHYADTPLDNYVTLNPNAKPPSGTYEYQYGSLRTYSSSNNVDFGTTGTIPVSSGKWYFECQFITNNGYSGTTGWLDAKDATVVHSSTYPVGSISNLSNNLQVKINSTTWTNISNGTFAANGVWSPKVSVAFDADTGKLWVKKATDTSWYNSGDPAAGTNPVMTLSAADMYVMFACQGGSNRGTWWHVSEDNWDGTAPIGYKALSTSNLPNAQFDPRDSEQNKDYFKAVTYQGNDNTRGVAYGYKDGSRAAVFNGTTSRIVIPKITDITGDVTYSTWARLDSSISSSSNRIRLTEINQNGSNGYAGILSFMYRPSDGEFLIRAGNGTSSHTSVLTHTYQLETERWYHIAATRNDTTNVTILYINGVAVDTETVSVSASYPSDAQTWIGDLSYSSGLDYNWSGEFDEIRIYSKALNPTEVGYLVDDDTSNISAISNLVAYYDMEGDANDESGSATTYNGNISDVTFTQDKPYGNIDVGFAPDLVWLKRRDNGDGDTQHFIFDSINGPTNRFQIRAATMAQDIDSLTSFDINGFSLDDDVSCNGGDQVAWVWKAAGYTKKYNVIDSGTLSTSNTASDFSLNTGTITPDDASINKDAGFSIIRYRGSGSANSSFAHGLSKTPDIVIIKSINDTKQWFVHALTDILGTNKYLLLNTTGGLGGSSVRINSLSSTTVNIGSSNDVNESVNDYMAYIWHSVDGFSKIGSYTGNGSGDGPFIYTGFKPAFVIIKRWDTTGGWIIFDHARENQNPLAERLYPDLTNPTDIADSSGEIKFFSNGFKLDSTVTFSNANGGTYIYMAFADDPFTTSNATGDFRDATVRYKDQPDVITTAVATNTGIEYTKDDGANWTLTQPFGSERHRGILYDGTYWWAGGVKASSGVVLKYSTDLTNWNTSSSGPTATDIKQISTDGTKIIAIGDNSSGQNVFSISNVGTPGTWTTTNYNTSAFNNQFFQCGIFGINNRFILGTTSGGDVKNRIYYTDNYGSSWTNVTLPIGTNSQYITAIVSNYKGEIVAAGRASAGTSPTAVFSPDNGTTWIDISSQFSGYYIFGDIAYNEELGLWTLISAYSSMYIYTSENGVNWTLANTLVSGNQIYTACGSNGRNIYACSNGGYWKMSNDGVNWDSIGAPSTERVWRVQSDYMPDLGSPIT